MRSKEGRSLNAILLSGFILIIALFAVLILTAYTGLADIERSEGYLYARNFENVSSLKTLRSNLNAERLDVAVMLATLRSHWGPWQDDLDLRRREDSLELSRLTAAFATDGVQRGRLQRLTDVLNKFAATRDTQVLPSLDNGKMRKAGELFQGIQLERHLEISAILAEIQEDERAIDSSRVVGIKNRVWRRVEMFALLGFLSGLIVIALAVFMTRTVSRQLASRRVAEDALDESEQNYRDLVEGMAEGLAVDSVDGILAYVNPRLAEMLGYSPAEMVGKRLTEIVAGESLDLAEKEIEKRREGIAGRFEMSFVSKTGKKVPVIASGRSLYAEGRVIGSLGLFVDITERKEGEKDILESEDRYRSLFEGIGDSVLVYNPDGRLVDCNQAALKQYGYSRPEFLQLKLADIVDDDFLESANDNDEKIWAGGVVIVESVHRRRDGKLFPVEVHARKIVYQGEPAILGVVRDISERKRAEESIRQSEEKWRLLVQTIPDYVALYDSQGRYEFINHYAEGFSEKDVVGKYFEDFISPDSRKIFREAFEKARQKGITQYIEYTGAGDRGDMKYYDSYIVPVIERGKSEHLLALARDITERKRSEEALKVARNRLERLSHRLLETQETERRNIARELHDEIGQILTAMKIDLQVVRRNQLPGKLAERLDESIKMLNTCLQRVRDLSLDLRPAVLDDLGLEAALSWQLERFRQRAGFDGHLTTRDIPNRLKPELEIACFRIAQEAMTNITKHAKAKSVKIDVDIRGGELILSIKDDGIGFDAGRALADAARGKSFGVLGMQERVALLGGQLEINSANGKGTVVAVRLPLRPLVPNDQEGAGENV